MKQIIVSAPKIPRLLWWLLIFWVLTVGLVSGSSLLGKAQFAGNRLAQLHFNSCILPCWIGITPGQTRLSQAVASVKFVFHDTQFSNFDDNSTLFTTITDNTYGYKFELEALSPNVNHDKDPIVETILIENLN